VRRRDWALFADRDDAGERLAEVLAAVPALHGSDVVVLGLPRGGVPVAFHVARALGAPLDVIVVRKLGVPGHSEYAMGAIGEDGVRILDDEVVRGLGVREREIALVERAERAELDRRLRRFRGDRAQVPLTGKTAIVVDDGVATGSTARAACRVARAHGATRVVMAVPVAPPGWEEGFASDADATVAVATPEPFRAVGQWYVNFDQTTDDEVASLLRRAAHAPT
jgi:putative phosphoribosyl transferase